MVINPGIGTFGQTLAMTPHPKQSLTDSYTILSG